MSQSQDLAITNALVVHPSKKGQMIIERLDVLIQNGKIAELTGPGELKNARGAILNAEGLHLLPGAIDTQVHFRDPGFPEKEDLASGTLAAVYGGVTSIFDMPNTNPPTLTAVDLADKMNRAKEKAWCNYAFYMGASPANIDRLPELETLPGVCGVKMFLGSSTGNLVVGTYDNAERVLRATTRRVAIHSEDDERLRDRKKIVEENPDVRLHPVWRDVESAVLSTTKILEIARRLGRKVHLLHVTTREEIEILRHAKDVSTVELTPQHLTLFAPDCYEKLGTLAQMNPPIRELEHREALWRGLLEGVVDVIGSDHAPHTLKEKSAGYPKTPSGMTGVQTLLPIMLHHALSGQRPGLTIEKVVELTAQNPARIFNIKNKGEIRVGFDADLALVDLNSRRKITNSWIQSRCGWTPFDGMEIQAWVKATLVGGQVVMRDDTVVGRPGGRPIEFHL